MEFIVLDDQPLSVLKNEGFNWAFGAMVQMSGRKYISKNCFPQLYENTFHHFSFFFCILVLDWYSTWYPQIPKAKVLESGKKKGIRASLLLL